MANVLFLGVPSHGHVNPTVGLVAELVKRGERVTYFASPLFQERIEGAGAIYRSYAADLDMFKAPKGERRPGDIPPFMRVIQSARVVVDDIQEQTKGEHFDYMIHSAAFPFAKPMRQILGIPTVSSLAVFFGLDAFMGKFEGAPSNPKLDEIYRSVVAEMADAYGVELPESPFNLIYNVGDLNLVYTSKYFAGEIPYFDDTYKFVGPPVSDRVENVPFPFERIEGTRVLYISLGTVFGSFSARLYDLFFQAFADWDGVVVMAAYGVDQSNFEIPENFLVCDYVPQNAVLKRASAAITHCGMNSMNDILVHQVPFVSLPMGADQPLLAARAQELGATLALDPATVNAKELHEAVETTMTDPCYREGIFRIAASFQEAGGFPKAVDEIFELKRALELP